MQFMYIYYMYEVGWKCYRCNLSFKDEDVANIHKQISNHSVSKERIQIA